MNANPGPHRGPPTWFTKFLARDGRASASVFVIEAWVGKRWRPIAQSDYEASARRLFNQVSYVFPVETLLRLRQGSDVLIKMPVDGLGGVTADACRCSRCQPLSRILNLERPKIVIL